MLPQQGRYEEAFADIDQRWRLLRTIRQPRGKARHPQRDRPAARGGAEVSSPCGSIHTLRRGRCARSRSPLYHQEKYASRGQTYLSAATAQESDALVRLRHARLEPRSPRPHRRRRRPNRQIQRPAVPRYDPLTVQESANGTGTASLRLPPALPPTGCSEGLRKGRRTGGRGGPSRSTTIRPDQRSARGVRR